jgi:hypothetical protein
VRLTSSKHRRNWPCEDALTLQNIRFAQRLWTLSEEQKICLKALTREFQLSVLLGDLRLLDTKWYVTYSGLTRLARRRHCAGIEVRSINEFCDPAASRWVFEATAYKTARSKGFVGYGDADPSNTSALVRGAEMRVAETRAVNRALRKAYGIGLCSVEELGSQPFSTEPPKTRSVDPLNGIGSANGQPSLRDKLCLLIRNYDLDPTLVKRYAADFCGTETLREASRDLVESFVSTISEEAAINRAALVCKLNSYNQPEEVRS